MRSRRSNLSGKILFEQCRSGFYLDRASSSTNKELTPYVAEVAAEDLRYCDASEYGLLCYTIRPDHVHVVFKVKVGENGIASDNEGSSESLFRMMRTLTHHAVRKMSLVPGQGDPFWQNRNHDHVANDELVIFSLFLSLRAVCIETAQAMYCKRTPSSKQEIDPRNSGRFRRCLTVSAGHDVCGEEFSKQPPGRWHGSRGYIEQRVMQKDEGTLINEPAMQLKGVSRLGPQEFTNLNSSPSDKCSHAVVD